MALSALTSPRQPGALVVRLRAVADLDREIIEAMWDIFRNYYSDIDRARFEKDLKNKEDVFLLFDPVLKKLQGFSTIKVFNNVLNGVKYVAIYSGDTIVNEAYWGQTALQRGFFNYILSTKLKNPGTAVYWFLISKGYKTYLLLSRNFPNYWPRHDKETPQFEGEVLNQLALEMFGDSWNRKKGILSFDEPMGKLKSGIAPIDQSMLEHPDIKFFLESNTGHAQGDELCCLGKIDADLALSFPLKQLRKASNQLTNSIPLPWPVQS